MRGIKTVDTVEQTGFPCPVRPDDGEDLTLLNTRAHPGQNTQTSKAQMDILNLKLNLVCHTISNFKFQIFQFAMRNLQCNAVFSALGCPDLFHLNPGLHPKLFAVPVADIRFHSQLFLVPVKGVNQMVILCGP